MPWNPDDAERHTKKANDPKRQRMWAEVANSVLSDTGDEGRAVSARQTQRSRKTSQSLLALISKPQAAEYPSHRQTQHGQAHAK
jgi:hypothetical protein